MDSLNKNNNVKWNIIFEYDERLEPIKEVKDIIDEYNNMSQEEKNSELWEEIRYFIDFFIWMYNEQKIKSKNFKKNVPKESLPINILYNLFIKTISNIKEKHKNIDGIKTIVKAWLYNNT